VQRVATVDQLADRLLVEHPSVVAHLHLVALEVDVRVDDMRVGLESAFQFVRTAGAVEVRDGQADGHGCGGLFVVIVSHQSGSSNSRLGAGSSATISPQS